LEATNMLTIARAVVEAARTRVESRGCHRRTDATTALESWRRHLDVTLRDGEYVIS